MDAISQTRVERAVAAGSLVGEGALWDASHGYLYWTDINGFRLERADAAGGARATWRFAEPVCALAQTNDPQRLLVTLASRLILWSEAGGESREIARPDPDPDNRLNDGAVDGRGRFWVGSMRNNVGLHGEHVERTGATGILVSVAGDGSCVRQDSGYNIANGVVFSPDGRTLYCASSLDNVIFAYDFDLEAGRVSRRRVFHSDFERGVPDGCAVDVDGCVWSARHGGGCVIRITPAGRVDRVVEIPATNVTNCAFGGDGLATMFVTTAALNAPAGETGAGDVYGFMPGVAGLGTNRFQMQG